MKVLVLEETFSTYYILHLKSKLVASNFTWL